MRTAKTLIRLGGYPGDAQADLSLRWAHSHFVCFVMSRLFCLQEFDLDATLITTVVKTGLRRDSATVQALVILADRTVVELSG